MESSPHEIIDLVKRAELTGRCSKVVLSEEKVREEKEMVAKVETTEL